MQHLTDLAQAAIGFDSARGDQVSVEDMAFEDNSGHPPVTAMEQFMAGAAQSEPMWKYGALLVALLCLVFFVVRPMMKKSTSTEAVAAATLPGEPQLTPGETQARLLEDENEIAERQKKHAQMLFDSVAEHLRREPAQTTRLLQSWIHTE
jgi:flagellar M-ring protein FliF